MHQDTVLSEQNSKGLIRLLISFLKEMAAVSVSVLIPQAIIDLHEPSIYGYSISINSTAELLLIYRC
jgi:hypothetical protein